MDAAEYKHIVLGLIFLKYISDAFDERRAQLLAAFKDEGGDLHLLEVVANQDDAEMRADPARLREEIHDAVGAGIGGDVEVFRLRVPEQITDTAAHQPGLMS